LKFGIEYLKIVNHSKQKLYGALPAAFRIQYPKFLVPDGDKYLMKYLSIDDEKEVNLSLKIGGH
jgi:hypothetical protein